MTWTFVAACVLVVLAIFFVAMVIDERIMRRNRDRHIMERYHGKRPRSLAEVNAASEALTARINARWKVIKLR